ncbi:MAG: PspA/IM30 family protein [Bradymonadaceae bacterium]
MSLLDRLDRLVRSNVNDLLGGDGPSDRKSLVEEMEASLREGRRRRAELEQVERELDEAVREARDRADEWEERAMLALKKGDEDLAREALRVKKDAAREAHRLREQLEDHRSRLEDLDASIEALAMKLDSHSRRSTGSGRSERARELREKFDERQSPTRSRGSEGVENRPPRSTSDTAGERPGDDPFGTDETFGEFDRMASQLDRQSARTEARAELDDLGEGGGRREELERRFRQLEGRAAEDREPSRPSGESAEGASDDLAGEKRRMDRLSELKDRFDDED